MKKLNPVMRTLLLLVIGMLLGLRLYSWNAQKLTGDAVPMPFGYGASVVLSGSMEPTLSVGDLLIIHTQEDYSPGEIVVYQSGSMPVVHRIMDITEETVTTRGDANNVNDEPFPITAIKGEVIAVIPAIGYLVWALKSPVAIVIMLAAAVFLLEWSFRSGKAEKEKEKERIKAEIRALMDELKED